MKWSLETSRIDEITHCWGAVVAVSGRLSFAEIGAAWRSEAQFRAFWVASLQAVPFGAYCWECPPVHEGNVDEAFECVFVSSPSLARMLPEPEAFAQHFRGDRRVATFDNLGGDARLIAPAPDATGADYSHLAAFTAKASPALQDALWAAVGDALLSRVSAHPLWLSTAGHGVAWLHVRLDSHPKYYRHAAYRGGWGDGG